MIDTTLLQEHGLQPSKIKDDKLDEASLIISKLANIQYLGLGSRSYSNGEETLESVKIRLSKLQEALVQLQAEARVVLEPAKLLDDRSHADFPQGIQLPRTN